MVSPHTPPLRDPPSVHRQLPNFNKSGFFAGPLLTDFNKVGYNAGVDLPTSTFLKICVTTGESVELQELQRQADERLESLDSEMLKDLTDMEQAAANALHGSTS